MANLKLMISKAKNKHPKTGADGFSARVVTNGTSDINEIAATACRNTTIHKAEAKVAFELCMEAAAELLKQGMIVDLGPVGKIYPSCQSTWVDDVEKLKLEDVKPTVYYHPSNDVESAVKGAELQWNTKKEDKEKANGDSGQGGGTVTPTPSDDDNPGGGI